MDNNNNRVSKYYSLPALRITELKEKLKRADAAWGLTPLCKNAQFLFGIEIEVEQVKINVPPLSYWNVTQDGSLRLNGREFVSLPLRLNQIPAALAELNTILPTNVSFSGRTSVHIHMNVRDLTITQIYNLILTYYLFEKVLFKWVGHNRDKNNFCIPITDTDYLEKTRAFLQNPHYAVDTWVKYSALNLYPIKEKGTVEFRHMYGTANPTILLTWIQMLSKLKEAAKLYTTQQLLDLIIPLNTTSDYNRILEQIFQEETYNFQNYPLQELMEKSITDIKLATSYHKQPIQIHTQPLDILQDTNPYTTTVLLQPGDF